MAYSVSSSRNVTMRNKKIILYGDVSTRKTESVLRYFPHVLLIDSEGNSDQCVDVEEIPEFLQVKTKDIEVARQVLRDVANGKIKFSDGSLVETVCIDSYTVFWSVRQETGSNLAEKRSSKSADETNMTMRDWVVAKRPLKEFNTELGNLPVRFLVLITREKDKLIQRPGSERGDDVIKAGVQPDMMKGTDYEANLILWLSYKTDPKTGARLKWFCRVDKVQGSLSKDMPIGKEFNEFPWEQVAKHSSIAQPSVGSDKSESAVATEQAEKETTPKTWDELKVLLNGMEDLLEQGREMVKQNKQLTPADVYAKLCPNGVK